MVAISLSSFKAVAMESGRVVFNEDKSVLKSESRSFKDSVLSFLSHVPLLKNMDSVREFVNDRNTTNEQVVALLATALANAYDSMPAGVAIEMFGKGRDLNESTLKEIIKNCEKYYGTGSATEHEDRFTINLWPMRSIDNAGHVSTTMHGEFGEHVSWWSDKTYDKEQGKLSGVAKFVDMLGYGDNFVDQYARSLDSYETDTQYEMGTKALAKIESGSAPRPTQLQDDDGNWYVPAQKINLPVKGVTNVHGETKNVRFGLNKDKANKAAQDVKENAEAYKSLTNIKARAVDVDRAEKYAELTSEIDSVKTQLADTITPKGKETVDGLLRAKTNLEGRGNDALLAQVNSKLRHIELTNKLKNLEGKRKDYTPVTQEELDAAQARADASGPEIGYRFASKTNNCASMAMLMLEAGGAFDYVAPPKMTTFGMEMYTPDAKFAKYVKDVQKEMDRLNALHDRAHSAVATGDTDTIRMMLTSGLNGNKHELEIKEFLESALEMSGNIFQNYV